jgi:(p)ppGpp synthase/HD superfamily hydrolase
MNDEAGHARPEFVGVTERFDRALDFATKVHRHQVKKGTTIPYIAHLLGVCALVLQDGGDEYQAIAALLHDAPEDQGGQETLDEIRAEFGDRVVDIVQGCSDTLETPKPPWTARKQRYLDHLETSPEDVLCVSLADKLYNVQSLLRDYLLIGDSLWERFNAGADGQLWYHNALADVFRRRYPGMMANELSKAVSDLNWVTGTESAFARPPES